MFYFSLRCLIIGAAILITFFANASLVMKPSMDSDLMYSDAILEGTYNSAISKPEKFLGFEVGDRVATPLQIVESLEAWSSQSARIKVIEYARSHEGRPLHAVFISSPDNISRLDEIKNNIIRISDSRKISESEASKIMKELPATAWMAYSIHGNETSGPIIVLMWAVMSDDPAAMEKVKLFFEYFQSLPSWFTNLWILVVASIFGIKGTQIFRNGKK